MNFFEGTADEIAADDIAAARRVLLLGAGGHSSKEAALAAWRHVRGVSLYQTWARGDDGRVTHLYYLLAPHQIADFMAAHPCLHSVAVADEPTRVVFDLDRPFVADDPHPFGPDGAVSVFLDAWKEFCRAILPCLIDGDADDFRELHVAWSEVDFREKRKLSVHFLSHAALESPQQVCNIARFFLDWAKNQPGREALYRYLEHFDTTIYRPTGFQLRLGAHLERQTALVPRPAFDDDTGEWRYAYKRREVEELDGARRVIYRLRARNPRVARPGGAKRPRVAPKQYIPPEFYAAQRLQGAWVITPEFDGERVVCARNGMPVHAAKPLRYDYDAPPAAPGFAGAFDSAPVGRALLALLVQVKSAHPKDCAAPYTVDRKRSGVVYASICPCHGYDAWSHELVGLRFDYAHVMAGAVPVTLHSRGSTQVKFKLDADGRAVFATCESHDHVGAYRLFLSGDELRLKFYPK